MLSVYLDESSDQHKSLLLCVGGIIAPDPFLQQIQGAWDARLKSEEIDYFRYTDWRGLHGSFLHFRKRYGADARNRADKVLSDLEAILLSTSWIGVGMGIIIQEYRQVLREFPGISSVYLEDPTEAAYEQMMYEVARAVRKNACSPQQIAYVVDQSSDYPKIASAFRAIKVGHPIIGRTMTTILPLDDKVTPSLQMADLVTGKIKESFAAWLHDRSRRLGENWGDDWNSHIADVCIWDRPHMLRGIRATLNRVRAGKIIALRPALKLSPTDRRKQEKARRKALRKMK